MLHIAVYKDIIENIPVAMLLTGNDLSIHFANRRARSLFQIDEDQVGLVNLNNILHGNYAPDLLSLFSGTAITTFHQHGKEIFLRWSVSPADAGVGAAHCITIFDITAEQQAIEHAALLVNNTKEPFMVLDEKLIIRSYNKAFDYLCREFLQMNLRPGSCVLDFIAPDQLEKSKERYARVLQGYTEVTKFDVPYTAMITKFFENQFSPIKNEQDDIIGVFISSRDVTDITEKLRADEKARQILEEKNTILESIGDAFFAVDRNWVVLYWNHKAEEILGKRKDEIVGKPLWDVFNQSVGSLSYKKYSEALETNVAINFEDYYEPLVKWYSIDAYPSENGLSVYFKDITERKLSEIKTRELNSALEQHARELAVSNKELEQFAYVASHDLQEPLRMITSFVSQLDKKYSDVLDEKGKKYIEFAVDGARRMRQIILDLLEFSRVGRGGDEPEAIDINELIVDIEQLYREQIAEKNATITHGPLPQLRASRGPLRQVFQNLISNALKYSKKDEPANIHIEATDAGEHWMFAVVDNGIGIDAAYFEKIFVIFQRLHNKDEYSGTGMGLAVTKKIVENMGGQIWVESEEEKGSTFLFTISKSLHGKGLQNSDP